MKTIILQIGGLSASTGKRGSMISKEIDQLQARYPSLQGAIEYIDLSARVSSVNNAGKFLMRYASEDCNLLIAAKSLGCVRINKVRSVE